jgi:hypothetical protein
VKVQPYTSLPNFKPGKVTDYFFATGFLLVSHLGFFPQLYSDNIEDFGVFLIDEADQLTLPESDKHQDVQDMDDTMVALMLIKDYQAQDQVIEEEDETSMSSSQISIKMENFECKKTIKSNKKQFRETSKNSRKDRSRSKKRVISPKYRA